MDNIIVPTEDFDFDKLSLTNPMAIQGGGYFTKILNQGKPLYVQTTKCLTKQGFVQTGKALGSSYYCDLMFDSTSNVLINWFEKLEETCQKLIFDKSQLWFQNPLELSDVENAFASVIKVYKSGKYYLVRSTVKRSASNELLIKIYDESLLTLTMDDLKEDTSIISILEIQGIKFTSRNFSIDIEMKQVMIIKGDPIFNNCVIKPNYYPSVKQEEREEPQKENKDIEEKEPMILPVEKNEQECVSLSTEEKKEDVDENNMEVVDCLGENNIIKENDQKNEFEGDSDDKDNRENMTNTDDKEISCVDKNKDDILFDVEELSGGEEEDLVEVVDFDSSSNDKDAITLKKPNQVYFDLYREAKKKAKEAKKSAVIAYLEAKNIKKTYMIDTLNDSDSDFDAEIEEVSESELDSF